MIEQEDEEEGGRERLERKSLSLFFFFCCFAFCRDRISFIYILLLQLTSFVDLSCLCFAVDDNHHIEFIHTLLFVCYVSSLLLISSFLFLTIIYTAV